MIVNLSIAVVSSLFLVLAIQIEATSDDLWGPKIAPLFLAGTMLIISVVAALGPIIRKSTTDSAELENAQDDPEGSLNRDPIPLFKITLIVLLGVLYFYAISLVGYLISTTVSLFLILMIFENTNLKKISAIAVIGAAFYYAAFIRVLGIHDPGFKLLEILSSSS